MINKHAIIDRAVVLLGNLFAGKNKFFQYSIESPSFYEFVSNTQIEEIPGFQCAGVYEIDARYRDEQLDPAIFVYQWKGWDYPTVIYHHGNSENPFDLSSKSKNTFRLIFTPEKHALQANIICLRAPFHKGSGKEYASKITSLHNFMLMLSVSVLLIEELTITLKSNQAPEVLVTGLSLGGWVTNLHHTYFNSADSYIPMLAGTFLGDLFYSSIYRKMTGNAFRKNPEVVRDKLNFFEDFAKVSADNVYPLLARYDQYIKYSTEKQTYQNLPLTVLDYGHITTAFSHSDQLFQHIQSVLFS